MNTKNNSFYNYLRDNPIALEKVFNLFALYNQYNSERVYIGSPFPEATLANTVATHLYSDFSVFQQYVNNQITQEQFTTYYNNALDFTNGLSGDQNYWSDNNYQTYNNLLSYILQDYTNRKNFGYLGINFLMVLSFQNQKCSILYLTFQILIG